MHDRDNGQDSDSEKNAQAPGRVDMKGKLYRSFDELPPAYENLLADAGAHNFYFSLPWYKNLTRTTLDDGDELVLIGVEDDSEDDGDTGHARAILVARQRAAPLLWPRILDLFVNFYTMIGGPALRPDEAARDDVINILVRTIRETLAGVDVVQLKSMDPDSPDFKALEKALSAHGYLTQSAFSFVNWYEPCRGKSYEAYVTSLSGKMRNLIGRRTRKLERGSDVRWTLTDGSNGGSDFDVAMAAYWKIYDTSWKLPEPYPDFIDGFVQACIEVGTLRLGILYVNDEPAAAQIWTVTNGAATIYKLAYDEKFKNLSVGSILTANIMEQVLDVDRPDTVDFGIGNDPYKKDWTRQRRDRRALMGFRIRRPLGALAAAKFLARQAAKSLYERLRGE
ncbi:MAG: GNAT family N-acetyltransferase [Proteobacteria bacterium]|nr:GNAT family N-acetyltransferase [Pseudomonadota bacterium]